MSPSWLGQHLFYSLVCTICACLLGACQASDATPTLQPGEVEIPFTTVFLDEEGMMERPEGAALILVTNQADLATLQPLIKPEAWTATQGVDLATYDLLALFRVPGDGCARFGVTIDRLVLQADIVTVQASDWWPSIECVPDSASAYHIIQIRKADAQLSAYELNLQLERQAKD